MKQVIRLSERTINHMKEFNDHCPTRFVIDDIANHLNIECDYMTTSLKDLGVERASFTWDMKSIELYFKEV